MSASALGTGGGGMKARVHITLKDGVLDPQGKAIAHALETLGFHGVAGVRQGKYIHTTGVSSGFPAKWALRLSTTS